LFSAKVILVMFSLHKLGVKTQRVLKNSNFILSKSRNLEQKISIQNQLASQGLVTQYSSGYLTRK
jgi:hypothetical protein